MAGRGRLVEVGALLFGVIGIEAFGADSGWRTVVLKPLEREVLMKGGDFTEVGDVLFVNGEEG